MRRGKILGCMHGGRERAVVLSEGILISMCICIDNCFCICFLYLYLCLYLFLYLCTVVESVPKFKRKLSASASREESLACVSVSSQEESGL